MVDVGGVEKSNIRAFTGQWEEKRGGGGGADKEFAICDANEITFKILHHRPPFYAGHNPRECPFHHR